MPSVQINKRTESYESDEAIVIYLPFVEHLQIEDLFSDEHTKNKEQIGEMADNMVEIRNINF